MAPPDGAMEILSSQHGEDQGKEIIASQHGEDVPLGVSATHVSTPYNGVRWGLLSISCMKSRGW